MIFSGAFILNAAISFIVALAVAAVLGPGEYGRFAIAFTIATTLGTLVFDWVRLSTTRFYGEVARAERPDLRATLDALYLAFGLLLASGAVAAIVCRVDLGLSAPLIVAIVALSITNSTFEYGIALARARFLTATYVKLIVVKNLAAFALAIAAAIIVHRADAVLAALAISTAIASLAVAGALRDVNAPLALARRERVTEFARYGLPVVVTNVIYQIVLLINRWTVAERFGYAASGQLSLATDLSIRLLLVIGAGLDVFLFQLVVRREATHGDAAAQNQVARNMLVLAAVLIPFAVGYAETVPAFAATVIPTKYRGTFPEISSILIPGILGFCFVQVGLTPVFLLAKRTMLLAWPAVVTLFCDFIFLSALPRDWGTSGVAVAHSASLAIGFAVTTILAFPFRESWPRFRDFTPVLLATGAMALAVWPARSIGNRWIAFPAAVAIGVVVYGAFVLLFDIAGLRTAIIPLLKLVQRAVLRKIPLPNRFVG